jgi:hypothetical protein
MNCAHCQNEMQPHERFCSKCGADSVAERAPASVPAASKPPAARDWDTHVKVLAWILIISAIFMAVPGLSLMLFPGIIIAGHMFPATPLFGPLFLVIALVFITIPAGIAYTGIGLLQYREWGRSVATILAIFMLIGFPFFTAIGIYALWVLNSKEGSNSYKLRSAQAVI